MQDLFPKTVRPDAGPLAGQRVIFVSGDAVVPVVRYRDGRHEGLYSIGDKMALSVGHYRHEDGVAIWEATGG